MSGDRIFSFLVLSLMGTGVTFGSPSIAIAAAQSSREFQPIAQFPASGTELREQQPLKLAQNSDPQDSPDQSEGLKLGDEGGIVTELQNRLKELGHYEGEATGKYDEKTKEAVAKFQTSQELEPTGIFDNAAFEKLQQIQNIPPPRRARQPKKRPWGWKRRLVFIGGGGTALLIVIGGVIFVILNQINRGKYAEEELPEGDLDYEEESDIQLTELYPSSSRLQNTNPNIHSDAVADLEDGDRLETQPFTSTPIQNRQTWTESTSPKFTNNHNRTPAVSSRDRSSLTPSLAQDSPANHPGFIPRPQDSLEELIRQLHSPDPDKRKKTIWDLARDADSRAVQPLVSLLLESDSQQQSLILEALSQIGTRTLKPMNRALALSLQDDNAQVRKNAIRDLTCVYELVAQLSQLIYYATDDPDPEVQETAKWALGQLSHIRMMPSDRNHE